MHEDARLRYVIPKEGCTISLDSFAIRATRPTRNWRRHSSITFTARSRRRLHQRLWLQYSNRAAVRHVEAGCCAIPLFFPP